MPLKFRIAVPSSALKGAAEKATKKTREAVKEGLQAATSFVESKFTQYAHQNLSPEGALLYTKGVSVTTAHNPASLTVAVKGKVPEALEQGFAPFDMKPALLAGRNVKQGKNGPYVDVPLKPKASEVQQLAKEVGGKRKNAVAELIASNTKIRRISANSPPKSWIHPGFKGIHALVKLADQIRDGVLAIVKDHLKKEGVQ